MNAVPSFFVPPLRPRTNPPMLMTVVRPLAQFALLAALATLGCHQSKGPELAEIERLNAEAGNVGRYMVPYYTALYALPEGGAKLGQELGIGRRGSLATG